MKNIFLSLFYNFSFLKHEVQLSCEVLMAAKKLQDKQPFASISDAQTWEKDKKYVVRFLSVCLTHSLSLFLSLSLSLSQLSKQ